MKRRHIQAIALATLVFVTLTGARRGGGCDDSSSGSSSSSSTGGHDDDFDIDVPGTAGRTSSGGRGTPDSDQSIRVTDCRYNRTTQKFTSTIEVTNGSQNATYSYGINLRVVQTNGSSPGRTLGTDLVNVDNVGPGQSRTVTAETVTVPLTEQTSFECKAKATSLSSS